MLKVKKFNKKLSSNVYLLKIKCFKSIFFLFKYHVIAPYKVIPYRSVLF